jgi:hypothetical protein
MKLTQPSLSSPSTPVVSALALAASSELGLVRSGLVAEYRFNEGSGQILYDYSGNNNHGTLGSTTGADTNDPTYTGQGASFTTDDYIITRGVSAFSLSQYTIIAVVKPTAEDANATIFAKNSASGSGAGNTGFILRQATDGSGVWKMGQFGADAGGTLNVVNHPTTPIAGSWVMVTGACDGSNVYISLNNGAYTAGADTFTPAPNVTLNTRIGSYAYSSGIYFEGSIAFIGVWSRKLTQAEITQNYNYLKGLLLRERGIALV